MTQDRGRGRGGGKDFFFSSTTSTAKLDLFLKNYERVIHGPHVGPNCDFVRVEITVFQQVVASEILK